MKTNFDYVIKNATVYDGTGNAPYKADVAVKGEKIIKIGHIPTPCTNIIDADGLSLSPGFIDIHTHDDIPIILDPYISCKIMQGITTSVAGNCGASIVPFKIAEMHSKEIINYAKLPVKWNTHKDYMEYIDKEPAALNVILQAGHNTIREGIIGNANRKTTNTELMSMKKLLEEAVDAGVFGMSSGLYYIPGCYADKKELIEISNVMQGTKCIYASHIRDEAKYVIDAIKEAADIGLACKLPVQISHIKCEDYANWGKSPAMLGLIDKLNKEKAYISMDIYPYTASSTDLKSLLRINYGTTYEGLSVPPENILIVSSNNFPEFNGKTLHIISKEKGKNAKEIAADILETENVTVVQLNNMTEEDLCNFLKHPLTSIGSDGLHSTLGNPHPRLFGTFPRILGRYSRERKIIPLETAIYKMTGLTAKKYNLKDRGLIKTDYYADLVLFDSKKIIDKATFTNSKIFSEGIEYVFVNGRIAVKNGVQTKKRSGKMLRRNDN